MVMFEFRKLWRILSICAVLFISCASKSDATPEVGTKPKPEVPKKEFVRKTEVVNYVEYRNGNAPFIISVPHDGSQTDEAVGKRTKENCPDPSFSTARDINTSALADLIDSIFVAKTGKYPYMVIGRLSRKYVDFNRELKYAIVEGSDKGRTVYNTYHDRAYMASDSVTKNHGAGLLIDIHGHGHEIQQIELGYLLKSSVLKLSNEDLASNVEYIKKSSIYNLVQHNKSRSGFIDLLRGANSFGSILYKNGLACVPHSSNLSPGSSPYFSGGYITQAHGSSSAYSASGVVDAIQCEFNRDARTIGNRKKTAEAVVNSVLEYMKLHYTFKNFEIE